MAAFVRAVVDPAALTVGFVRTARDPAALTNLFLRAAGDSVSHPKIPTLECNLENTKNKAKDFIIL